MLTVALNTVAGYMLLAYSVLHGLHAEHIQTSTDGAKMFDDSDAPAEDLRYAVVSMPPLK